MLAGAMATGAAAPVDAQPQTPLASAPVKSDKPFDGSREQFLERTQGMSIGALETFRSSYLGNLNSQKIAADQAIPNITRIKDKGLFDIVKKSLSEKLEGKPANPVTDVKGYLDRKEAATNSFFEQRMKSGQDGPTPPNEAQMKAAKEALQNSSDTNAWANATKGWDQYSLQQLKGHAEFDMKQSRMFGGSAASLVAGVNDPKLLAVVAQTEQFSDKNIGAESALRGALTKYTAAQNKNMDEWSREAKSQAVTAMVAPTIAVPASAPVVASTTVAAAPRKDVGVPEVPRMSSVDCKAAANDAARGGTTTAGTDGRLKVSPADIMAAAKDISSKPQDQWPDFSKWDKFSLRSLKMGVAENVGNQMNAVRQAGLGILAGNDPATMLANIQNPEIRKLMEGVKPGMPQVQQDYLQSQIQGKISENFSAARVTIDSAIAGIEVKPRERTPVNAPVGGAAPC